MAISSSVHVIVLRSSSGERSQVHRYFLYLLSLLTMLNAKKAMACTIPSPAKQDITAYSHRGIIISSRRTLVESLGMIPPFEIKKNHSTWLYIGFKKA